MLSIDVRLVQDIKGAIAEELTKLHRNLGNGSQIIRESASATGMNCTRLVGEITGLETALKLVEQSHRHLTNPPKKDKD